MRDVPEYEFRVPRYLVRYSRNGGDLNSLGISLSDYRAGNGFEEAMLPELEKRGVKILDPVPLLSAKKSPALIVPFDADGSFYVDSNHLSRHGAMTIKPLFDSVARSVSRPSDQERTALR
jgi:hypothetical protein